MELLWNIQQYLQCSLHNVHSFSGIPFLKNSNLPFVENRTVHSMLYLHFFRKSMTHKTPHIRTLFFSHTPVVKYKLLVVLRQLLSSFSHKQAMSETFFHHNSLWERGVKNSLNFHYQPFEQLLDFAVKLGKHDLFGKSSAFCVEQGCSTFFVGGPYNQLQTSRWAARKI